MVDSAWWIVVGNKIKINLYFLHICNEVCMVADMEVDMVAEINTDINFDINMEIQFGERVGLQCLQC